jgi:hypothetical protein
MKIEDKCEIPNSKSETNSNDRKAQNIKVGRFEFVGLINSDLLWIWRLGWRILLNER